MLKILLATCETALKEFEAAETAMSPELVADLHRIAVRVREELETATENPPFPAGFSSRGAEI